MSGLVDVVENIVIHVFHNGLNMWMRPLTNEKLLDSSKDSAVRD
jgi:hypothetical protein